jgi:hypothetical protein
MIRLDPDLTPEQLMPAVRRLWELSAAKIVAIERSRRPGEGAPVFTVEGRYTSRGWTDWTEGFQFGSALLQFEATGEPEFLDIGRRNTLDRMPAHVTHFGVHDHGFNIVSTYGNLRRLILEGRADERDLGACELALRCSGAVQARRWTPTADGGGFIHSFNGPHSLFVDTIRSLRSLALAHDLGHALVCEQDQRISLLDRLSAHLSATARWSVYYGDGRDAYDVRGRTAHESLFNPVNGEYRCPSTQQGYSPFSTWTRGLAWAICGFAEQIEWLGSLPGSRRTPDSMAALASAWRGAEAAADFYIEHTPTDGIPYWDTGAPGLVHLGDWRNRPAEPGNDFEPVDSSAAAIAAQGLVRLGRAMSAAGRPREGERYAQAALATARTLLSEPYLSTSADHEGLTLHAVYHRPNGWDFVPAGRKAPCGEACMWGDYHVRELALMIARLADGAEPSTFFGTTIDGG